MNKNLIRFKSALDKRDSLEKTYGYMHSNHDICSNNSIPNICAFTSKDCVCKRPPRSWKRMLKELKEKEDQK